MPLKKPILLILTIFLMSASANFSVIHSKNYLLNHNSVPIDNSMIKDSVEYLIITTEEFKPVLEPLAEWKTQKGVISKIEIINDIDVLYSGGNLPEKIKNCIIEYQSNNSTQWVLLAGDHNHVPTKYIVCDDGYSNDGDVVCCDSYYGDIDNDWASTDFDYESEVYVGRLPANSKAEMQNLVNRILSYEKNPRIGDWMTHAIFAGAILQFDIDWDDDDDVDYEECDANRLNNYINNTLLPNNWTSVFLAQTQGLKGSDYHTDAELDYPNLKSAINQGGSIGTIFAHGRAERMSVAEWTVDEDGDGLFDYTENPFVPPGGYEIDTKVWEILFETTTADLIEADELGIYYFGSCSVGTFDYTQDCIAEYFLKKAAIGCVAGSYVVWGEDQWYERTHGGWFVDGLGYRFLEQLFQYNQPGKALALAKADYALDRVTLPDPKEYPEWGNKTLKQYNLLGDPEIPIWLSIPKQLNVTIDQPYNNITNSMTLLVSADENPVQGATITYTENNNLIWMYKTNENGTVEVPFPQIEIENKVFTASKQGFLPFQIGLPQNDRSNSIPGYNVVGLSFIILGFVCLIAIYYKHKLLRNKSL